MHYSEKKKFQPSKRQKPLSTVAAEIHFIYMVSKIVKIAGFLIKIMYCRSKHFQKSFLEFRMSYSKLGNAAYMLVELFGENKSKEMIRLFYPLFSFCCTYVGEELMPSLGIMRFNIIFCGDTSL